MGVSLKLEPNTSWNCWLFFLLPLSAASWQSPGMDTVATAMVHMATAATATVMVDTTMERGRLSLLLLLSQDMATTAMDTATATATDTATAMDTAMDTTATMARGRLSLLPLLRLMPLLDMATMAMDTATATDTATAMDAATATDTTATTARGRLLLSPDTDTAATVTMDTAMDTDMAMDTAMATATTDREGQLDCVSNHDVKSSVKAAMKFCC